jgi:hypothetical protein
MARLRATEIFNDAGMALIAVESVEIKPSKTGAGCRFYAGIEPVAVIVCRPGKVYALDMNAEKTALDRFMRDIPGLSAMIAS